MKVAYVAGPYQSKQGEYGVKKNIESAEKVAIVLWRVGYAVICPHKNTAFLEGACPRQVWLDGYIELLKRSDIMVLAPGWQDSQGTLAEIDVAKEHRIPIYRYEDEISMPMWWNPMKFIPEDAIQEGDRD